MTEERFEQIKEKMCSTFQSCTGCPLFEEASRQGMHACGALCDLLFLKQPERAAQIVTAWEETHA